MTLSFPKSIGAVSGWMMCAFLLGIAAHSFVWKSHVEIQTWAVCLIILAFICYIAEPRSAKIGFLIVFAFVLGVWRFDTAPRPPIRWIDGHVSIVQLSPPSSGPLSILPRWRHLLTERILQFFPRDDAMLMIGMLYGDETFSKDQRKAFISAGLMHLVAVSGSNVTIMVGVFFAIARMLKMRRRWIFWFCSMGLVVFVGFVGASASVLRAALTGWLILVARECGRLSSPFRLLLVSATVFVALSPWILCFDISFALSYLSMWGVLAWTPIFGRWFRRIPASFGLREALSMTCGAMLATLPYSMWVFGRVSLAGVFTNALVFPFVSFAMGCFTLAAAWGSLPLFTFVRLPALGLARFIDGVAKLSLQYPWMQCEMKHVNGLFIFAFYIVLIYFELQLRAKIELSTERDDVEQKKCSEYALC